MKEDGGEEEERERKKLSLKIRERVDKCGFKLIYFNMRLRDTA